MHKAVAGRVVVGNVTTDPGAVVVVAGSVTTAPGADVVLGAVDSVVARDTGETELDDVLAAAARMLAPGSGAVLGTAASGPGKGNDARDDDARSPSRERRWSLQKLNRVKSRSNPKFRSSGFS